MASTIDFNLAQPVDGSAVPTNVIRHSNILSGGDVPRVSSVAVSFDCSQDDLGGTVMATGETKALIALPANAVVVRCVVWQINAFGATVDFGWEDSSGTVTQTEDAFIDAMASGADTVAVSHGGLYAATPLDHAVGNMPPLGTGGGYVTMTSRGSLTTASKGQIYVEYIVFGGDGSN
tara:strand:+ start:69 stop:599 length:531 start_codon:yes stop_codon:yes gene_type:complete